MRHVTVAIFNTCCVEVEAAKAESAWLGADTEHMVSRSSEFEALTNRLLSINTSTEIHCF